jgi:hypothetical protein
MNMQVVLDGCLSWLQRVEWDCNAFKELDSLELADLASAPLCFRSRLLHPFQSWANWNEPHHYPQHFQYGYKVWDTKCRAAYLGEDAPMQFRLHFSHFLMMKELSWLDLRGHRLSEERRSTAVVEVPTYDVHHKLTQIENNTLPATIRLPSHLLRQIRTPRRKKWW